MHGLSGIARLGGGDGGLISGSDLTRIVGELTRLLAPSPVPLAVWQREVMLAWATRHRNTRNKMRQALRELLALAQDGATTIDLTPALIDQFAARRGRVSTTNGLLASLHAAVGLAVKRRYTRAELVEQCQWRVKRLDPPRRKHHAREEVRRLLDELGRLAHDWEGRRLEVLGNVLAYCGLRPGEAYRLRVEDLDLERGFVFVRPNGGRLKTASSEAPVPVCGALAAVLARWLPECGSDWLIPRLDRQGPWLHGTHGRRPGDRLTAVARSIGISGLTPRSLRHSLATHLAGWWGLSPRQIQLMLRHSSERTQWHYIHPDLANLRQCLAGFGYHAVDRPGAVPPPV